VIILITTNAFSQSSAGIYSQHKLCHKLRERGFDAYLVMIDGSRSINPDWDTPVWTGTSSPVLSVAIYSELIHNNPLKANISIYWILGDFIIQPNPSKTNGKFFYWYGAGSNCLQLNNLDLDFFAAPVESKRRNYVAYKGKNRNWQPTVSTDDAIVSVERFGRHQISREDFRDLLSSSKAVLIAEDSLVIEEAIISGCPVIVEPGIKIHRHGRPLPSLYLRRSKSDWPDLMLLSASIRESQKILLEEGPEKELTLENLLEYLNSVKNSCYTLSLPPTFFPVMIRIRIKTLRLVSAFRKGGCKDVLLLLFEVFKS